MRENLLTIMGFPEGTTPVPFRSGPCDKCRETAGIEVITGLNVPGLKSPQVLVSDGYIAIANSRLPSTLTAYALIGLQLEEVGRYPCLLEGFKDGFHAVFKIMGKRREKMT